MIGQRTVQNMKTKQVRQILLNSALEFMLLVYFLLKTLLKTGLTNLGADMFAPHENAARPTVMSHRPVLLIVWLQF